MATTRTAGYSGTPLARKLGIEEGTVVCLIGAPDNYAELLEPVPPTVEFTNSRPASADLVHLFSSQASSLQRELVRLRKCVKPDTPIWVSWPKKASRVPTDITEDTIRALALPLGFVDIKVCAVSDIWSGLKLVIRRSLRTHDA